MAAEGGVGGGDAPGGVADPVGHGCSGPLRGAALASAASGETEGAGEVVDQRVELGAGPFGSGEVVVGVGVVDVVVEVADAGLVLAAGAGVDHLAGVGLDRGGAGQLDAVDLAAGLGEQHGQVVHALGRRAGGR